MVLFFDVLIKNLEKNKLYMYNEFVKNIKGGLDYEI